MFSVQSGKARVLLAPTPSKGAQILIGRQRCHVGSGLCGTRACPSNKATALWRSTDSASTPSTWPRPPRADSSPCPATRPPSLSSMPAPVGRKPPPCAVIELPSAARSAATVSSPLLPRFCLSPRSHRYRGRGVSLGRPPIVCSVHPIREMRVEALHVGWGDA